MWAAHLEHLKDSDLTQKERDQETHFLHDHIVLEDNVRLPANLQQWTVKLVNFFMCWFDMKSKDKGLGIKPLEERDSVKHKPESIKNTQEQGISETAWDD